MQAFEQRCEIGTVEQSPPAPASGNARSVGLALTVLIVCSIFSYMDRQVVSLVAQPIKVSLHISDTQLGLLQGLAFTLCYAIAGLPLAFAVDRLNRVWVAAACVICWSLATSACGLVAGFGGLLIARALTAVSEAGFSPAALSILSDKVGPSRIARISALFLLGPPLGTGFALLFGGLLLHALERQGGLFLPGGAALEPWQGVFVLLGLPGIILGAALLMLVSEPARSRATIIKEQQRDEDPGFFAALGRSGAFIIPYVVGTVLIMLVQFTYAAWVPTFFVRHWHLEPHRVGPMLGPIFILLSITGALTAGYLARASNGMATLERLVAVVLAGSAMVLVTAVLLPFMPSLTGALLLYAVLAFALNLVAPLATAPWLMLMPSRLRGRSLAAGGALLAIIGAGGGPLMVGLATDHLFHDDALVGQSLALVCGLSAFAGILIILVARRAVRRGWNSED